MSMHNAIVFIRTPGKKRDDERQFNNNNNHFGMHLEWRLYRLFRWKGSGVDGCKCDKVPARVAFFSLTLH